MNESRLGVPHTHTHIQRFWAFQSKSLLMLSNRLSSTGNFKGMCKQIDHFPEETDYEADPSEYFLREYES